jgi:hypothetical protein
MRFLLAIGRSRPPSWEPECLQSFSRGTSRRHVSARTPIEAAVTRSHALRMVKSTRLLAAGARVLMIQQTPRPSS